MLAALAAPGCKAGLDGPTPSLTSVSPRVVCGGSSVTVTITGTGLSAVPVGALGSAVKVAAPRVFLRRVEDLKMLATTDEPVRLEDPANPDASLVHTISDTQLAFDLRPELMLPTGIYSIDVLSPSAPDVKKTSLEKAIAITAAPSVTSIDPGSACVPPSSTSFTAKVTGFITADDEFKADVKMNPSAGGAVKTYEGRLSNCTDLPMDLVPAINVKVCNELRWSVAQNDLPSGEVTVEMRNRAPADACAVATKTVTILEPPTVSSVARAGGLGATLCATGTVQPLGIQGKGFAKMPNVAIAGQTAKKTTVNSETSLNCDFSNAVLQVGQVYEISVTNPDGCAGSLPMAITILGGPEVLFVDPPSVYFGITTPVALYLKTVKDSVSKVEITKNGAMPAWSQLDVTEDPNHPKRIFVSIPKGMGPGAYDLRLTDGSSCPAIVQKAITLVDNPGPKVTSISRPTGAAMTRVAQTVIGTGFASVPLLFLSNASGNATAVPVPAVAFNSATELSATFPAVAAGTYDIVAINPDGGVGVLPKGYTVGGVAPPRIDSVVPPVFNADVKINFTITGANFHDLAKNGVDVTLKCTDNVARLAQVTSPSPTVLKVSATDFSNTKPGTTCIVRVTNTDDMGFAEYAAIAISNPNGGAVAAKAGPKLRAAREGAATVMVAPPGSPHYVVAVGGDSGDLMKASLLDSAETLKVDGTGPQGSFVLQRNKLPTAVSRAGGAALGRYIYVVGGNDGSGAAKTVYRALLLDPAKAPSISTTYLEPAVGAGLNAGRYSYRVSAILDANNADNPGGETVASDPWVVAVPSLMSGAQVTLTWTKVTGAVGYVIYRSPMGDGGLEQVIGMVGDEATYTDMGGMAMGSPPLLPGSVGKWVALASLGTARQSPSVVIAGDPGKADTFYLYAIGGSDGNAPLSSVESLTLTVAMDGSQSAAAMWSAAAEKLQKARSEAGAWVYASGGTTYIYVGGGKDANKAPEKTVEVTTVTPNSGAPGKFADTGSSLPFWGFAAVAAGAQLIAVGNHVPDTKLQMVQVGNTPLALPAFAQGGDALLARTFPGAVIDGPLLFVIGGLVQSLAVNDTEWMVY